MKSEVKPGFIDGHYHWVVVIGCSLMIFFGIGIVVNCFSIFLQPLITTLGISNTRASSIVAVQNIGVIISSFLCNRLCPRFGARKIALCGGMLVVAGYLSLSIITNLTGCYIGFFVVGFGCGLGGMIPASIILTAWFRKKRGFALSIASMASALATVIYPKLILLVLNRYSIFSAYRLLALSVAMMVILAFCLVRDCPQDKGMLPYGQDEAEHFDIAVTKNRRSVLALLQKKSILCLLGTGILLGGMINSISAHISILYISEGYDSEFAASMVSLFGIVMLVVKPVYGILVDWFGLRKMSMVSLIMLALSTCIPMCFHLNIAMPYLFVILYGCTSPLTATVFPLWSDVLGAEGGGVVSVYPIYRVCTSVGAIIASTVPGYMADQFGSYVSVFYVYFFLCVISFIVIDRLFRYIRYQEE